MEVVYGLAAAAVLVLLATLGVLAWRRHVAARALLDKIESVAAAHLRDVLLPDGSGGWFHVDFLLLTAMGLLVIDLRDLPGLIFGSEQMTEWTVMQKHRRFTFPNPLGPLYDRMAVVRSLAGEGVPVDGRVVFMDRATFPKGHPPAVTRLTSLVSEVPALGGGSDLLIERLRPAFERIRAASSPSPLRRR